MGPRANERKTGKSLLNRCAWLSISQSIIYASALSLWKTMNLDRGKYWSERILSTNQDRPMRRTSKGRLKTSVRPNLKLVKDTWRWRTVMEWNEMMEELRTEVSMKRFKAKLSENTDKMRPKTQYFSQRTDN